MYGHRQPLIEILEYWVVAHKSRLGADDIFIEANGRTRLCIDGLHVMDLGSGLVDKRQHHIEWYAMLFKDLRAYLIAMVHEIARPDCGKMQETAIGGWHLIDPVAYRFGKSSDLLPGEVVIALDEAWDDAEVDVALLGERLHGIEHAIVDGHALKAAHGH